MRIKKSSLRIEHKAKNFADAIRLIRKIASLAEAMDHHPDIHLTRYRHLGIVLTTHDAGGVTQKDHRLAKQIQRLFKAKKGA